MPASRWWISLRFLAVAVLLIPTALSLEVDSLADAVPRTADGFSLVPESQKVCFEENLTEIYDAGYYTYIEMGVVVAVYALYTDGSNYFLATLHMVNTPANVSRLLEHFRSIGSSSGQIEDLGLGDAGFRYDIAGSSYLCFSKDELLVSMEGSGGAVKAAMEDCAEKILHRVSESGLVLVLLGFGATAGSLRRRLPK